MFRHIYRQRRRILFSGFFSALTIGIFLYHNMGFLDQEFDPLVVHIAVVLTSLVVAGLVMALMIVFVLFIPYFRHEAEMLSLAGFVLIVLNYSLPAIYDHDVYVLIGIFAPILLLQALIYGPLLDRFALRLDHHACRSFRSPKSAPELWAELVPGAGPVADYWDSLLSKIEPLKDDPDSRYVEYRHGPSVFQHQTQTVLRRDYPHHYSYAFRGDVNPANSALTEGTCSIDITPRDGGGCDVTLTEVHNAMLPRTALMMWFDDSLGDVTDHLRARHRGRGDWTVARRYRRKVMQLS